MTVKELEKWEIIHNRSLLAIARERGRREAMQEFGKL
jgi:hypothetical protein